MQKLKRLFINWLRQLAIKKLNLLDASKYTIMDSNVFSQGIVYENDKSLDDFIKDA